MDWLAFWRRPPSIDVEKAFRTWVAARERREQHEEEERREAKRARNERITRMTARLLACAQVANAASHVLVLPNAVRMEGERECWKRDRRQNNFSELFDDRTTDETFKRLMRMTRASFAKLLGYVESDLMPSPYARGDFMSPCRTLCLTILRLAHGTSFLELSQTFAIGISTAHKCYARGIQAIVKLERHFICPPLTVDDVKACIDCFAQRGFPNACLAVDGCHVPVELADQYEGLQDFICYKGFYSLNNMAYVDGKGQFRAVLCGWAGASADGGVLKEMEFTTLLQVRRATGCLAWSS